MEHNSAIGPFGSGNLWIRGLRSRALQPHPDFTYVHPQRRHFPCVWVQLVGDDCVHFAVNTPVRGAISVGAIAHSQHSMVQALTALRTWQIFPLMFSPFLCMHKSMMLANAGLAARRAMACLDRAEEKPTSNVSKTQKPAYIEKAIDTHTVLLPHLVQDATSVELESGRRTDAHTDRLHRDCLHQILLTLRQQGDICSQKKKGSLTGTSRNLSKSMRDEDSPWGWDPFDA
eukprot:1156378-Pelagomonas_calceolata.AAC.3